MFIACGTGSYSASEGGKLQRPPLTAEAAKNFRPLQVNSIAVLPLQSADEHAAASDDLQQLLLGSVEARTSLELLNRSESAKVSSEISRVRGLAKPLRDQASELGRGVGAQGVIYGIVTRYEEIAGSRLGAERPAHVGFRLWLIDPKSGQQLWTASYDNQDQPLSDNLFRLGEKLKTGVGFRSASELMKLGFDAAGDELERLRAVSATGTPAS